MREENWPAAIISAVERGLLTESSSANDFITHLAFEGFSISRIPRRFNESPKGVGGIDLLTEMCAALREGRPLFIEDQLSLAKELLARLRKDRNDQKAFEEKHCGAPPEDVSKWGAW